MQEYLGYLILKFFISAKIMSFKYSNFLNLKSAKPIRADNSHKMDSGGGGRSVQLYVGGGGQGN